jgi:molybdate transport system ATP-binding protein
VSGLHVQLRRHVLDVDLRLQGEGPVTVLFGPSGAGKTTLLRCVAGLERPDAGTVTYDGRQWDGPSGHVPARRRRVGYLFQAPTLFPRLTAGANVAYGLRRLPRGERRERVAGALALTGAGHLHDRRADLLSGGEAQRVALARALAPGPRLLLLDEPLSALDAPTRAELRTALRRVLVDAGVPTLLVTHDRSEALALGDDAVVLDGGRVRQTGPLLHVFDRPADAAVARIVGVETTVPGRVEAVQDGLVTVRAAGRLLHAATAADAVRVGDAVLACVRAEDVALETPERAAGASPRNHWPGTVRTVHDAGPLLRVTLDCGFELASYITRSAAGELRVEPGRGLVAAVKAPAVHLIPRA